MDDTYNRCETWWVRPSFKLNAHTHIIAIIYATFPHACPIGCDWVISQWVMSPWLHEKSGRHAKIMFVHVHMTIWPCVFACVYVVYSSRVHVCPPFPSSNGRRAYLYKCARVLVYKRRRWTPVSLRTVNFLLAFLIKVVCQKSPQIPQRQMCDQSIGRNWSFGRIDHKTAIL